MIKYNLKCTSKSCQNNLPFDAWFQNSEAFDTQKDLGFLICPYCGDKDIVKNLMSPSIQTNKTRKKIDFKEKDKLNIEQNVKDKKMKINTTMNDAMTVLRTIKKEIQNKAEFVGDKFVDEARAINLGETKERPIYGSAKPEEVEELKEEGISVTTIPWIQDDH